MADLTYQEALAWLYPRTTTIKFGLERTERLLESLGNPERMVPVVHVGGTNGKGSVATLVAAALQQAGHRVGLFTSPHLCSFRERVRVDGAPISARAVAMWVTRLRPLMEDIAATFFEANTAIAFADFAARGAEIAVVEVGLGGRLDSTNVVSPLVSAVTRIALDHQKYLGDTIEAIAREKAGIAKAGAPFVIGEPEADVARLLEREARDRIGAGADIRILAPDASWSGPLRLSGPHQRRNAAVAAAVLDALPPRWRPGADHVLQAFRAVTIPGRLDCRGRWIFDVAHNPDGVRTLVTALESLAPRRPLQALVSILGDKPWAEMLVELDRVVDLGILTIAPSADTRRWDLAWLHEWLRDPARPPARAEWHLVPDFTEALRRVDEGAGTILVTGSFHTVGDVMAVRGLCDVMD